MCGRYTQTIPLKDLRLRFKLSATDLPDLKPRYNIAPSQEAPVVLEDAGRALKHFRWGLIPSWAKDPKIAYKMINARSETVAEKPSYKRPFTQNRCLVVADSFYEWRKDPSGKTPMRIVLESKEPFAMAGLWDTWKDPKGQALNTFTIITTPANDVMRPIHDRMPAILRQEDEALWLDPRATSEQLMALLVPSQQALEPYAVSSLVNAPGNDLPGCIEAAPAAAELPGLL